MRQVNQEHYRFSSYVSKERFASYWEQISNTMSLQPDSVLEVGPGGGIVTRILRESLKLKVTTFDFAPDVGADIQGSVCEMPFDAGAFDVVVCCQVLEHIQFEQFEKAVSEIARVSKKGAVVSVPHFGRYWKYEFRIPLIDPIKLGINLQFRSPLHKFDGQHYWEIGKSGFTVEKVKSIFNKYFSECRTYRLYENPYHQFFVLKGTKR